MAEEHMSVEKLATSLEKLSRSVDERFEQVDRRFEQIDHRFEQIDRRFDEVDRRFESVDRRFDTFREEIRQDLEAFAVRIENRVVMLLENMKDNFRAAFDLTIATAERLDRFERSHAEEHRLIQAQIDDLDRRIPPPRRRGRRSS